MEQAVFIPYIQVAVKLVTNNALMEQAVFIPYIQVAVKL